MAPNTVESMPYGGESPQDRTAFSQYMEDVSRGKSLIALIEMRKALTPAIRNSWYSSSFTAVDTSEGRFDALTCNLAYHFAKHGAGYGTIANMTAMARAYFVANRSKARLVDGKLKFPNGSVFMPDGRIVTFI